MTLLFTFALLFCVLVCLFRGRAAYDAFVRGAKEGLNSLFSAAPSILAAVLCAKMLEKSGAALLLSGLFSPLFSIFGIPTELSALAVLRPISGSAGIAWVQSALAHFGPDSYLARAACTMSSSAETVFYTFALYGAKGKSARWAWLVSLASCLLGMGLSCGLCKII